MRLKAIFFSVYCLTCSWPSILIAATGKAEPKLSSLFPLGGQPGSTFEVSVRGENLADVEAVWFDCDAIVAQVESVETTIEEVDVPQQAGTSATDKKRFYQVRLKVSVDPRAVAGAHALRLVSRRGLSNSLALLVNPEPLVFESDTPISSPLQAQQVRFPIVINGRISRPGELDYYAFDLTQSRELWLEVITFSPAPSVASDPQLIIYEPSGSWFDPMRIRRLEVEDETGPGPGAHESKTTHFLPRVKCRFDKKGRYLAEVGTLEGKGGPDHPYQLRIVPAKPFSSEGGRWFPNRLAHWPAVAAWQERDFAREIDGDHLHRLWLRTVTPMENGQEKKSKQGTRTGRADPPLLTEPEGKGSSGRLRVPSPVAEKEPNDGREQAIELAVPLIVEGAIQRPGDVDQVKFRVKAGQALAFEIETPEVLPPFFSPHLRVLDKEGNEILSNIFREVGGVGDDWIKTIQAKTIYTFKEAGTYHLQIRDLTSRRASPRHRYRLLVRSQFPHLGEVTVTSGSRREALEHINLQPGETRKLFVVTEPEEGFAGEVVLRLENLPEGVRALTATTTEVNRRLLDSGNGRGAMHKERFLPTRQLATIVLVATRRAPTTPMPARVQVRARPVVQGKLGKELTVHEMLLMVGLPKEEQLVAAAFD